MLQKRSTGQFCNEYISAKMATFYAGAFKYWNKILVTRTKDYVSIVFFFVFFLTTLQKLRRRVYCKITINRLM